jgi:esterase/lipase
MPDYPTLKRVLEHDLQRQEVSYVSSPALHTRAWLHGQPTQRVCLLLHGFTAGPYQMEPLGQYLYQAGYNVVAPLLPGHGRAGTWSKQNPPPLPADPNHYLRFGTQWLNLAAQLGQRVVVGGLSGGGTLAAWLALEKAPQVDRAILCAPYFSGSHRVIDLFVQKIDTYFEWSVPKTPMPQERSLGLGYTGFNASALRAVLDIGQYCIKRVKQGGGAPTSTISSESDKAVSNFDHRHFFEATLKYQPYSWYNCFAKVLDIPHSMMTEKEGNRYQNLLNGMIKAFIESHLTWAEVEEIAYRMSQGRTFNAVVAELGWAAKCSPDLPAMITMVDKWAIVVERELQTKARGHSGRPRPRDR